MDQYRNNHRPGGVYHGLVNARPFSPHLERVYMKTRYTSNGPGDLV